jgi:purine-nucleoside phosphorylase
MILGSGLGYLAERVEQVCRLPFIEVPGLVGASVVGHQGHLTMGRWLGVPVIVFEGRIHGYEGHPWRTCVMPVQIAHAFGARMLLATNAAGGIHEALTPGSLMLIADHLDCTRSCWWRESGPDARQQPRPSPYSLELRETLQKAARAAGIDLFAGIYAQLPGPCYETPAEIRALRSCGVDAVGMSTAREIQAGHDLGMECAGISCITNRAAGLSDGPLNHEEVLHTAAQQRGRFADLVENFLLQIQEKTET